MADSPGEIWAERPYRYNHNQPKATTKTTSPARQSGGERKTSAPPKR